MKYLLLSVYIYHPLTNNYTFNFKKITNVTYFSYIQYCLRPKRMRTDARTTALYGPV